MNDNQVIVIVLGIGAVAFFMLQPGSKEEPADTGSSAFPPWYPRAYVEHPPSSRRRGEATGGKESKVSLFELIQAKIAEITERMQKYVAEVVSGYEFARDLLFNEVNASSLEGPMREDLRSDLVRLKKQCVAIIAKWTAFLNEKSAADHNRTIRGYQEYGLIETLTQNFFVYEQALEVDSARINAEQADSAGSTVNYYIQNITKYRQEKQLSVNFNQMVLDAGQQALEEPSWDASPAEEPPSRLAIEYQQHTGGGDGLPPATDDLTASIAHTNQPGFIANELPPKQKRDAAKAANEAGKGKSSGQRTQVKGGGAKPDPVVILDDPQPEDGFLSVPPKKKEEHPEKKPPRRPRSVSPAGRSKAPERTRSRSPSPDPFPQSEKPKPIAKTKPKPSMKRSRDMDSAPDPHNNQQADIPENRPKRGRTKPPAEFSENLRPGAHTERVTGPPTSPHQDYEGYLGEWSAKFLKADAKGDEDRAGVAYYNMLYKDPQGEIYGKYYSKIASNGHGGYVVTPPGQFTFYYLKRFGLTTARERTKLGNPSLNDILLSPEYKRYSRNYESSGKRMLELAKRGRGNDADILTRATYVKNASKRKGGK